MVANKLSELVIVGAGGFGRELLQWVKDINSHNPRWIIKGFIDDNLEALNGYDVDYQIIGRIVEWMPCESEVFALAIAKPMLKEKIVTMLKGRGARFDSIIHPSAVIGDFNRIGEGLVCYPNSGINVNVSIGNFVTLLSSGIGHDVCVGDYSTISSYCDITGGCKIGKRVFLGSHVTIIPTRVIGDDASIGAGSVVVTNIKNNVSVFGNPGKNSNCDECRWPIPLCTRSDQEEYDSTTYFTCFVFSLITNSCKCWC